MLAYRHVVARVTCESVVDATNMGRKHNTYGPYSCVRVCAYKGVCACGYGRFGMRLLVRKNPDTIGVDTCVGMCDWLRVQSVLCCVGTGRYAQERASFWTNIASDSESSRRISQSAAFE